MSKMMYNMIQLGKHRMAERTSFFQSGRDYESRYVNHRYLGEEKKVLSQYESVDYFSPHSQIYKEWVAKQPARFEWDRWVTMGCIGFLVGLTAFVMHQGIGLISENMHDLALRQIEIGDIMGGWVILTGISVLLVIFSSAIVVVCCPAAGGSGLPELIAYLNGTNVRRIFSLKTYVVKFISCLLAVGSGMPVGPEGPMIALGGLIGASVSQFKSKVLNIDIALFKRLRNSEDRRNFLTAGAGAGVSAAFGAPVGGLLFAMEEVSSFWSDKLGWQTFFCCMVSAFTADLFNSAFDKFEYTGNFGLFQKDNYIIFHVENYIPLNLLVFLPAILLGGIGGILGALFTFLNLKIVRVRKQLQEKCCSNKHLLSFVKIFEPLLIMVIVSSLKVLVSDIFPCHVPQCYFNNSSPECLGHGGGDKFHTELTVETFSCEHKDAININGTDYFNGTYNPFATVFFASGEEAIHHLFSRQTHNELPPLPLAIALLLYFPLACWTAGTSIASGLVVPMLLIGGLFGRLVGCLAVTIFGVHTTPFWAWLDPGAFALIGAASFFGGVSRLTMSLAVILMEMTNDIQFLLPIMVTIMVSKWVGDLLTHSFYHALLEVKCIPFLDSEPFITHNKEPVSLELFKAGDAMSSPVVCVKKNEKASELAARLLECEHSGFPVVNENNQLIGSITRRILAVVLEYHFDQDRDNVTVTYDEYLQHDPSYRQKTILEKLVSDKGDKTIDLDVYMNQSAVSVSSSFSLHRTYVLFRTMGLRHLIVTDDTNTVVGMLSRKDLMGHALEDRLAPIISHVIGTSA